ncbi:MAG: aminoglycoside phosphotransferase family protein [Chloroflexi bacterium]|nr:aminoglycoside phosphotransferase family protein [Chloroflexota bacterium]
MMADSDLDPYAILQELRFNEATTVNVVRGGSDMAIWRIERANETFALRVFHRGRQERYEREQAAMQTAQAGGIPVPKIHAAGIWHDYPALLLSWLPGWPLAHELRVRPWRVWLLGVLFGRMQAAIHALRAPDILLQSPDEWIAWPGPDEEALRERLRTTDHHTDTLLHLDYHPLNVLTDGRTITGVLDWTNAKAGDARADVARTVSILRIDFIDDGTPRLLLERAVRKVFERGWRTGYEQQGAPLRDLRLFYAWAGAVMERDLTHKREARDLARIHRWTMNWKERIGCL